MQRRQFIGACGCGLFGAAFPVWLNGCSRHRSHLSLGKRSSPAAHARQITRQSVRFKDVSKAANLRFFQSNGRTGRHYFLETTGAGCAFLDYDNDGWLDIFAVQSGPLPHIGHGPAPRNALFRNNRNGTFTDVTSAAGLAGPCGYGQGVSVADYDNDGYQDILVTSYGEVHLFHNNGDGTFIDVTAKAGLEPGGNHNVWSTSAAWADYDNDGHLDLFICRYVKWTPETDQDCPQPNGAARGDCPPQVYDPQPCVLYHNNGNGTFTNVSKQAGISAVPCKGLGVVWLDYDGDGYEDILVANDGMPNVLFKNNGDGTFTNTAAMAGVAYGENGAPDNGMGIAVADARHTGHDDIVIANYAGQAKSVFFNDGHGIFRNATHSSGIGSTSLQRLGFGCAFLDYDLDGWSDVVVANGHISELPARFTPGMSYAEPAQLFRNNGNGTFTEDFASLGDLAIPGVGRGLAVGDYDNDGAPDILISHMNGWLGLYQNQGGAANHWVGLRLEGTRCNRSGIGAKVWLTANGVKQYAEVRSGSSYCSHSSERLNFGLGPAGQVDSLRIQWPGGSIEEIGRLTANRFYMIREGSGAVSEPRLYRNGGEGSV